MRARRCAAPAHRSKGFTLIELLVGLVVMATLALLSWRALDHIGRAQSLTRDSADQVLRLQAVLGQWRADLDARLETGELPALDFDGRVLRLTRRDSSEDRLRSDGVRVVAWARLLPTAADGPPAQWARWQSAPLTSRAELAQAWQRAQAWGRGEQGAADSQGAAAESVDESAAETALTLVALDDWQLYYYRDQGWSNPQSSVGNERPPGGPGSAPAAPPAGVRLVLFPGAGAGVVGPLTIDWVDPAFSPASP